MTSKKQASSAIQQTAATQRTPKCGTDDGHDSIKMCMGYDKETNQYDCVKISSKATLGLHQVVSLPGGDTPAAYSTGDATYTVTGNQALSKAMDTRSMDYPVSDLNRVLVAHGLVTAGFSGQDVSIVTGLPVDQYYKDGAMNEELIQAKTESLLKPVVTVGKGPVTATIVDHRCVSEGIAAFYDALINGDGTFDEKLAAMIARRPVAVVDLGGKTLDQAVIMENGAGIYTRRSGTDNVGVLALYDDLSAKIKSKFKLNNDPPLAYVEEAFRTQTYDFFGETTDIKDLIVEACKHYVSEIQTHFVKKIGDGSDVAAVIFVGGGTALLLSIFGEGIFKDIFKGKVIIPEAPEFANARGNWKAAMYIHAASVDAEQIAA